MGVRLLEVARQRSGDARDKRWRMKLTPEKLQERRERATAKALAESCVAVDCAGKCGATSNLRDAKKFWWRNNNSQFYCPVCVRKI